MQISRIRVENFANFESLDVSTGTSIVIVGENKVGKSNLVRGLQLILDPSLSELDRQLGLEDFWDGLGANKLGATVEISVELTDFDNNPSLVATLSDYLVAVGPPTVARITYRFRPKASLEGAAPQSLADYEYVIFGGPDEDNRFGPVERRQVPLEVQAALRDAEKDLLSWRRSPLRPLIEELTTTLDAGARDEIQETVNAAQGNLSARPEVVETAERIAGRLLDIVGETHAVPIDLGLAPTQVDTLLRSLRILIDNGARNIGDASLGTTNLIFLALKSLELDRLVDDGERSHTIFAIEEPEAHLHPHVQRLVYRYFLAQHADNSANLTTVLSTHSPHIASVAPVRSIVLLRHDSTSGSTFGTSTADAPLLARDEKDLQRYIDVTRGELFFSRGIIFVEGDAEQYLIPAFAEALGLDLDGLGITVCSVGGTNFKPYIKLVGPKGLAIPHIVITDLDPREGKTPLAKRRLAKLLEIRLSDAELEEVDLDDPWAVGEAHGYFVNNSTLEVELFHSGLAGEMVDVIKDELSLSAQTVQALDSWVDDLATLDEAKLLGLIERIGKGRFAQALSEQVTEENCPTYIKDGLEFIRDGLA